MSGITLKGEHNLLKAHSLSGDGQLRSVESGLVISISITILDVHIVTIPVPASVVRLWSCTGRGCVTSRTPCPIKGVLIRGLTSSLLKT